MIISTNVVTDLKIESVHDLYKLKPFLEGATLKVNKSELARELGVDRRTVDKYMNGFEKSKTRNRSNCIMPYYDIISSLLSDDGSQVFYYKSVLWRYLVDNHGYSGSYVNFCFSLKKYDEFEKYFRKRRPSNVNSVTVRFETSAGKQAQLDWKESIKFELVSGEVIVVNIFVLLMSYSRFRIYRLSLSKTQDVLLTFLDDAFVTLGGVPEEILTDNMPTVMDEARTGEGGGKVNARFQQFADDYGFAVRPCMAGRPQTKAKVESQMKVLDEIRAYSGKLDYDGLNKLVERINNRVNSSVVQGTGIVPVLHFEKNEKALLHHVPAEAVRKGYRITSGRVKVNTSSMVNYKQCQYSVPPEYVGKAVTLQVLDGYVYVYYNTKLITLHEVSKKKMNYREEHYMDIAKKSHAFKEEKIAERAKANLAILGEVYGDGK